ncbi:MAG: transporter substrate-binding domain-containing protein [Bdellovibrio sp.]|nr:transporter substrate-binding domain-containing protein [Bdellovibrio sp.]
MAQNPVTVSTPQRTLRIMFIEIPPFYTSVQGTPSGYVYKIAVNAVKAAGFKPEAHIVPLKRLGLEIAEGNADIWVGPSTFPEFKNKAYIGTKPVAHLKLATWSFGQTLDIKNLEDLKKYRIVIIYGYNYGGVADEIKTKGYNYIEAKDMNQAYRLLSNKRADVLVNYTKVVEPWQKQNPRKRLRGYVFRSVECNIVVSRKTMDAMDVLKRLEAVTPEDTDSTVGATIN